MLRLPHFSFRLPATLDEVATILNGEGPGCRLVAGGTDLWPNMKRRHQKADTVVSLMRVPHLAGIKNGSGLTLGATTILSDITRDLHLRKNFPALARAVASISSPPLRNMGTIGGNLCVDTRCTYYNQTEEWRRSIDYCMKEEGTICWVAPSSPRCWAHSASDSAPVLCSLGAELDLVSTEGRRSIPIDALYRDDGIEYLGKRPDEILTAVRLPETSSAGHCRSSFWKLRRRGSIDFAVLSVAAAVWMEDDDETVERAALYLGAVASYPTPVAGVAELLVGRKLTEERIAEVGQLARRVATPMDNTDFQAQWRGTMTARYTEAALREIADLEPARMQPNHWLL
jgi:4-hydroxybenzoyl-CoA reductase subunit beta